jgi:hypothetical protein
LLCSCSRCVVIRSHQVYGINTEGKWNSDRVLPFPVYSDWAAVDTTRKQGFYLTGGYNGGNFVYRACYNSRPVTYTTTPIASLTNWISNGQGIVYDAQTQTLYVSDSATPSNVYAFNVTGTDCPQSAAPSDDVSSASTPASSALWSLLHSLLSRV